LNEKKLKMDSLEKFILENRTAFDEAVPSLKVWAEIDKQLEARTARRVSLWRYVRVAAAVVVLLISGSVIGPYFSNNHQSALVSSLAEVAPEYGEMEQYYTKQINQKEQQLASLQPDKKVSEDLKELDRFYADLKKELQNAPEGAEEQIVNAMINNYRTKLEILDQVLKKIQSTNQKTFPEEDTVRKKTEKNEISI